jgi:hypothetical protein
MKSNFVPHRWSPLPHETTLSINKILRASPRSVVVRLIAEQICACDFLSGWLNDIFSKKTVSGRAVESAVLRRTVSAHRNANPSLHSICIGPASAAGRPPSNGFIERARNILPNCRFRRNARPINH